jgi:hypothetical protein
MDRAAIVYLRSPEKHIHRAAAETDAVAVAQAVLLETSSTASVQRHWQPDAAPSEATDARAIDKMMRVADAIQTKTARARVRARAKPTTYDTSQRANTDQDDSATSCATSWVASSTNSHASTPPKPHCAVAAYAAYERVMAQFGVLSERAAALHGCIPPRPPPDETGRLIVEAVIRTVADPCLR